MNEPTRADLRQPHIAAIVRLFADAGLEIPPIPRRFADDLRTLTKWCFATRDINPMGMYMFDEYVHEALAGNAPDYLAFCHAGHGVNSYAISYHLVDGPLALFVQSLWGGAYSSRDADAAAVSAQFRRCAALLRRVEKAKLRGLVGRSGRLFVIESTLREEARWGWLGERITGDLAADGRLHDLLDPIAWEDAATAEDRWPTDDARRWLKKIFPA